MKTNGTFKTYHCLIMYAIFREKNKLLRTNIISLAKKLSTMSFHIIKLDMF